MEYNLNELGVELAKISLGIKAIKLNPDEPFTWASGYRMPIYNDNSMLLGDFNHRSFVANAFKTIIDSYGLQYDIIAGTSTAGIPPSTTLADKLQAPSIYVRDKPKDHGMKNQIEGIDAEDDLKGRKAILIEDLISTGGSSANAVQAIRNANGVCDYCLSIFNYGLDKAVEEFGKLDPKCNVLSILTYDVLLQVALETGQVYLKDHIDLLKEWRADPFGWGAKHGFPKIEKGDKK